MSAFRNRTLAAAALLVGHVLAGARGADWPQFRYDAGRTAATPAGLPAKLHLQWQRQLPPPRPAFPSEVRLRFDGSYEPVVLGETMFVPSMVNDSVTALDIDKGTVRWRFFTEGPVRFAPVAHEGKVYAASDDGYLYCLAAESGKLLWKFRGLPKDRKDRKLLGNRRLISLWPARGGPVVAGGTVYFAAGIWPSDGVFLHALDATMGKVIWSNTTSHKIPRANMDHGVAQYAGLTPQGYLAMVGDKLVVPCGAQLAAFLDPKNGTLGEYTMGWGGRVGLPKGSWFVAGVGKFLSHSGDLYDITRPNDEKFRNARGRPDFKNMLYPGGFTRLLIDPHNQRELAAFSEPVITEKAVYFNDGEQGITAYDLRDVQLDERKKLAPTKSRAKDQYPDRWKAKLNRPWSLPSKLKVHIKAGSRLYLGGPGVVEAIQIPQADEKPTVAWQAKIDGTPSRMLAADGKLFVVTLEGSIYAFGQTQRKDVVVHQPPQAPAPEQDKATLRAREFLAATGEREGYGLVLGIGDGRLVEALVRQSELYVIAVEADAGKADKLRERLHDAGLYGTRASVHVGDPYAYPYPPYFANLVVSEDSSSAKMSTKLVKRMLHPVRPYGGKLHLTPTKEQKGTLVGILSNVRMPGIVPRPAAKSTAGLSIVLERVGQLQGARDWSHARATAANTNASQDLFLKAPLGMLWFDNSLRWHRKPGSAVVRVSGGRVFVLAEHLHAVDVYTGRHLWQTDVPPKLASTGDIVAEEDDVYLAVGNKCLVLDPATGKTRHEITTPEGTSGNWSNLRVTYKHIVATIGDQLVGIDRESRKTLWMFRCGRSALSVAVGEGKVFCAELVNRRRGETPEKAGTKIRALNANNGRVFWEVPGGWELHYAAESDLLVTSAGVYQASDGKRLRDGIPNPQIIGDQIVSGTPDRFTVCTVATGEKVGEELNWYRRGCTGLRASRFLVTTRFKANSAYVDLRTREITPLWNIRPGCNNNLYPADGVLNVPNVTGGCECNYTPTSKAFISQSVIDGVSSFRTVFPRKPAAK